MVIAVTSSGLSSRPAAATFSATCSGEPEPGIGSIRGDRASSQASATCRGWRRASGRRRGPPGWPRCNGPTPTAGTSASRARTGPPWPPTGRPRRSGSAPKRPGSPAARGSCRHRCLHGCPFLAGYLVAGATADHSFPAARRGRIPSPASSRGPPPPRRTGSRPAPHRPAAPPPARAAASSASG
jgi:hypothetical protein